MAEGNGQTNALLTNILQAARETSTEIHGLRLEMERRHLETERRLTALEECNQTKKIPVPPTYILVLIGKVIVVLSLLTWAPQSGILPLIGF